MDGDVILLDGFDTRPVVAAVVVGVVFSGPMSGNCLFGTKPSHWGPCCLFLCRFPFAENDLCFADDNLPAVVIVATAEVVVAAVAIVVAVPLVVSAIDLGGGCRWRACVVVIIPSLLLWLYVCLRLWFHLHCVHCWSSWSHGCHLYLQRIYCGL